MGRLTLSMPDDLKNALKKEAAEHSLSLSAYIRLILSAELKK